MQSRNLLWLCFVLVGLQVEVALGDCPVDTYYSVLKDFTSIPTPYTANPQIATGSSVGDVAISPDCNYAVFTQYNGQYAALLDLSTNSVIQEFTRKQTYACQWISNDRFIYMSRDRSKFIWMDKIDGVWTEKSFSEYDGSIVGSTYGMDEAGLWAAPDGSYFLFTTADSGRETSCIKNYTFATDTWTAGVGHCSSQGSYDHTTPNLVKFRNPSDITVNSDQTQAYIADRSNHRLRLWDMVTNEVTGAGVGVSSGNLLCQICSSQEFGLYPNTVQYTPDYKHLIVGQQYNNALSNLWSVDMTTYVKTQLDNNWHFVTALSICQQLSNPFMLVNRNEQIRKVEFSEGAATCESCPVDTYSSAGSVAITDCLCNAGFTGPDGGTCQQCEVGTYKNSPGSAACTDCDAGQTSVSPFTSSSHCQNCVENTYENDGVCAQCPDTRSVSPEGSTAVTDCGCAAGTWKEAEYWKAWDGTCASNVNNNKFQADPYTYANRVVCCWWGGFKRRTHPETEECWHCPAGDCDYMITFFEAADICAAAGMRLCTFEEIEDPNGSGEGCNSGCGTNNQAVWVTDSCGAGYVFGSGYTNGIPQGCNHKGFAGDCVDCPANTPLSPAGSASVDACYNGCDPGQAFDSNLVCTQCEAGKYQPNSAYTAACVDCPSDSTSPAGSTSEGDCTCNAGYEISGVDCVACTEGYFKATTGDFACLACPSGEVSITTSAATTCICDFGYVRDSGDVCQPCLQGTYKANQGDKPNTCLFDPNECCECDVSAGLTTDETGSVSDTYCVCGTGYGYDSDLDVCVLCPHGTYKNSIDNVACTSCATGGTTDNIGSTSETACVANAGYFKSGDAFVQCASGTYQPAIDQTACVACPTGVVSSNEPRNSTSDCACDALGYKKSSSGANYCDCTTGFYRNVDTQTCTTCPVDSYCVGDEVQFQLCPANSQSTEGSDGLTDCKCNAGYSGPDGGPCEACLVNYFKDAVGSAACTACAEHSTSPEASVSANACLCNVGYSGLLGGPCSPCTAGKYKDAIGSAECTACAQYETSPEASMSADACVCEAGYSAVSGSDGGGNNAWNKILSCGTVDALGGTYTDVGVYDATGEYWTSDSSSIMQFSNLAWVPTNDFVIFLRYKYVSYASGNVLIQFPHTSYATAIQLYNYASGGQKISLYVTNPPSRINPISQSFQIDEWISILMKWTANSKRFTVSWECDSCVDGSQTSNTDITTNAWQEGTTIPTINVGGKPGGASNVANIKVSHLWISNQDVGMPTAEDYSCAGGCSPCEAGTFKTADADTACDGTCPADSTSPQGSDALTDCVCNAGYSGANGGSCTVCPVNTYKDAAGDSACLNCSANSQSLAGSDAATDCQCSAGYTGPDGGACIQCVAGKYKSLVGTSECLTCPDHSQSPAASVINTACQCNAGYAGPDGGPCVFCSETEYQPSVGAATCLACPENSAATAESGRDAQTDCLCNAGYTGADGDECSACAAGQYKITTGSAACSDCDENANSPEASTVVTDCRCNAGYEGADGALCAACAANHYEDISTDTCVACPINSQSPSLSSVATACQCNVGYTGANGGPCSACLVNTYKDTVGNAPCTSCDSNMYSAPASTNDSDCLCNAGYSRGLATMRRLLTTSPCQECGVNTYCPTETTVSDNSINNCLDNSVADAGSSSLTDCECDLGYTGPNGGPCTVCPVNTFKDSTGTAACTDCAEYSSSPAASNAVSDCVCDSPYLAAGDGSCDRTCAAGFEGSGGAEGEDACVGCQQSFYKTTSGTHNCQACPANSHSTVRNQTSIDACVCDQGYLWNGTGCDQCEAGKFNNRANQTACFNCISPSQETADHTSCPGLTIAPAGYKVNANGDNVELCPSNHHQDGSGAVCTECPWPLTYSSAGGLTSVAECECRPGYTRLSGVCTACDIGKYKPDAGDANCTACESHASTKETASVIATQCLCEAGFTPDGFDGALCVACPDGTSKHVLSNQSCIQCPSFSSLLTNLTHSVDSCQCNPGYAYVINQCDVCALGKFKPDYGNIACESCGVDTTTAQTASVNRTQCLCAIDHEAGLFDGPDVEGGGCVDSCGPGYHGLRSEGDCQACGYGKYKDNIGSACSECPSPLTASPNASNHVDNCSCAEGLMGILQDDFAVITELIAYNTESTESLILDSNAPQTVPGRMWEMQIHAGTGNWIDDDSYDRYNEAFQILVDDVVVYECGGGLGEWEPSHAWTNCADVIIPLDRIRGVLTVTGHVNPNTAITLRYHTQRTVEVSQPTWPSAISFAVNDSVRLGDYVFAKIDVKSTEECHSCAPGLICGATTIKS